MKTIFKNMSLLLVLLMSTLTGTAQDYERSHFPDRTRGFYTLGINGGFAYQSSDVCNTLDGFGVGLTLAKNYYYRPGSPISFDLRGRLLYSETVGLDSKRSTGILNNSALNGTRGFGEGLDYTSTGSVFQNHKTYHGELGLEAVLTANRLRERTGLIVSAFGGINLDWYNAKLDQANQNGIYDYSGIDDINDSQSNIKSTLQNNILDGVYESNAHGFEDVGKLKFMPSLGLELGYQFTPRFSMHVAHKATFSGTDDLDGELWDNNNNLTAENDIHHYTNAALRWIIEPAKKKVHLPEITILQPRSNPHSTRVQNAIILADIKHVKSAMDVECYLNGQPYNFDFNGKRLRTNVPLQQGENEVIIRATNMAGVAEESVLIIYNTERIETPPPPPPPPPSTSSYQVDVRFTSPRSETYRTEYRDFTVEAIVKNVVKKSDMDFYVNGRKFYDFSFNARNGKFSSRIELQEGRNEIEIVGRNENGTDRDEAVIIFERKLEKPRVRITTPSRNPYKTEQQKTRVIAELERVTRRKDVSIKVNGRKHESFDFDTRTGRVVTDVNLERGENKVVVAACNPSGESSDQVVIIYDNPNTPPAGKSPVVTITSVNEVSANQNSCKSIVKAKILNVSFKSQITFRLNGSRKDFSFNSKTKIFTANVDLRKGRNDIIIKATNSSGSDQDEKTSICEASTPPPPPSVKPPVVTIESPKHNSTSTSSSTNLKARIKNVRSKQDVRVKLNGNNIGSFSFNPLSGILTTSLNLKTGKNTISVWARNSDGTDEEKVSVTYNSPSTPPSVNITTPNDGAVTNKNSVAVKATVKNVARKQDVTFKVNGANTTSFTLSGNKISANAKLKKGKNIIAISVKNSDGNANDRIEITYNAPSTPPSVDINTPNDGDVTDENSVAVKATVKNVTRKQDVTFKVNGANTTNFTLSGNSITANVKLRKGKNIIAIFAKNADGNANDKVEITYKPKVAVIKPVVKFITPARPGGTARNARYNVRVSVLNVTNQNDIELKHNGSTTRFQFNSRRKEVTATIQLSNGKNTFSIKATNQGGTATANSTINYTPKPTVIKPTIEIVSVGQPAAHPFNPNVLNSSVIATIKNIASKNEIKLIVNGENATNFTYNAATKEFRSSISLKTDGSSNSFKIIAENSAGKTEKSYTYSN